jgi:ribosome-associated protein
VLVSALPLSESELAYLSEQLAHRISADGWVSVRSKTSRSQLANRGEARVRMTALLADALHRDRPRSNTRVPRSQTRARLEGKKRRGIVKRLRGTKSSDDD